MKAMYRLLLLLSFLYFTSATGVHAQGTIKGIVTDEKKLALPAVVIRLKNLSDTVLYKALSTDVSGKFIFTNLPPGRYQLQADLIGYRPLLKTGLSIDPTDTAIDVGALTLSPSSKMLSEVAITAQKPLIERLIDKTVINVDQNIANTGTNALELLKKLPGVQVTPDGQIMLNGKSGVNVIIDGKTTYLSADDLAALLSSTPSSDIQQIEIMTNPSAKYDAEGTGGIINIIRKKSNKSGLNGSITGSFGQGYYSRYNGSLVINYKTDKYNLYVNNSYSYSKSLLGGSATAEIYNGSTLLSQQVSDNNRITAGRAYNSAAGLDLYLPNKTTLTLSCNVADREATENINSVMNVFDGNSMKTGSENFAALNADKPFNYTGGVQLVHKLDTAGRQWSADADYSDYRYKPAQSNTTLDYDPSGNFLDRQNVFINEQRMLHIYGARVDYVQPLPGNGHLETGLKSSYVKTDNNSTYYNQVGDEKLVDSALSDYNINSENINAAYVNFNKQYQKLSLQAGLRAEQTIMKGQQLYPDAAIDQNYFQLFPTLFLSYKLNDQSTFNFQFGRRVNRADYHELVPFRRPLSTTLYFQGDPNLKPDLNWHTEVSWAWQNTVFITAAYDIDHDYVRTLPYLDTDKTTITRIPTNVQGARSWNVDISYNKQLSKWFTTNTTSTIYKNSFSGSADGFSLNDPGFATIDLVSNNSFRCSDKLSLEADFEYESKRQFVGSLYGAYSTVDLAMKEKILQGKGSITINANNILNSDNRSGSDKYLNLNQYTYTRFYSRAVIITFNYRFGSGKLAKTQSKSGSDEEQQRAGN